MSASALPILDISQLHRSAADRSALIAQIRHVARHVGFFYVTGHGVSETLADDVFRLSKRFFDLPPGEKLKIEMANSPISGATPRRGRNTPRGSRTGGRKLISGWSCPPSPCGPATRRGSACRGRTSGRRQSPS